MIDVEAILRRERAIIAAALAAITLLAWLYIWEGAGMGMSALAMTSVSLFPHLQREVPGEMISSLPTVAGMWWVMMIAMMTPSAAPLVLLYGRVLRHHVVRGSAGVSSLFLAAGYLVVWLLFSLAAALVQNALQPAGLLSPMMLWSKSAWLSAAVLGLAGAWQLSPFKRACLVQCRAPVQFLTSHWRPGRSGAFMMGVQHGAYCVGCCWMLMGLLFVGGVMNLVWIAVLTLVVLLEKLSPAGESIGKLAGVALIVWAVATLLV